MLHGHIGQSRATAAVVPIAREVATLSSILAAGDHIGELLLDRAPCSVHTTHSNLICSNLPGLHLVS